MSSRAPCKFFSSGRCFKGSSCPFSHDIKTNQNNHSNSICKQFLSGKCTFGQNCRYLHDTSQKSPSSGGYQCNPIKHNMEMGFCSFFSEGKCRYLDGHCKHAHLFQQISGLHPTNSIFYKSSYYHDNKILVCTGMDRTLIGWNYLTNEIVQLDSTIEVKGLFILPPNIFLGSRNANINGLLTINIGTGDRKFIPTNCDIITSFCLYDSYLLSGTEDGLILVWDSNYSIVGQINVGSSITSLLYVNILNNNNNNNDSYILCGTMKSGVAILNRKLEIQYSLQYNHGGKSVTKILSFDYNNVLLILTCGIDGVIYMYNSMNILSPGMMVYDAKDKIGDMIVVLDSSGNKYIIFSTSTAIIGLCIMLNNNNIEFRKVAQFPIKGPCYSLTNSGIPTTDGFGELFFGCSVNGDLFAFTISI